MALKYAKQKAYRARCVGAGRCPHCGEPCAPYAECERRRFYKRIQRVLRRGVQFGTFEKTPRGYKILDQSKEIPSKASGREGDRRKWPKIGDKPVDPEKLIHEVAREIAIKQGVVTEEQVELGIGAMRTRFFSRVIEGDK